MDHLPQDPFMLVSTINMLLRDQYRSLDELCDDREINAEELQAKMQTIGMEYNPQTNKFW